MNQVPYRRTHVNLWELLVLVEITDELKRDLGTKSVPITLYRICSEFSIQFLFRSDNSQNL